MALLVVGCGGGGGEDDSSEPKDGTTSTVGANSTEPDELEESTKTDANESGSGDLISAGDLDVTEVPDFGFGLGSGDVGYVTGGEGHVVTTTSGQDWLLSPDGQHVAVTTRSDAVRSARVVLIDMVTGTEAQSFDSEATNPVAVSWAPDSSAVAVSTGGSSVTGIPGGLLVYRLDGTTAEPAVGDPVSRQGAEENPHWVLRDDGMGWGSGCEQVDRPGFRCNQTQVVTSELEPLALVDDGDSFGLWDVDAGSIKALPGDPDSVARVCGRYGAMVVGSDRAIFDADTGEVTPGPDFDCNGFVPSPSGTKLAIRTRAQPVVVDLETGETTPIAREGLPVAWSADEQSLLVRPISGSFVVAADGSGGKETSVVLDEICPGGALGKVVAVARGEGVVVYDIGADSAQVIEDAEIEPDQECSTTADGRWTHHDFQIFDLETAVAGTLQVPNSEGRIAAVNGFRWAVPATTWAFRR